MQCSAPLLPVCRQVPSSPPLAIETVAATVQLAWDEPACAKGTKGMLVAVSGEVG